MRTPDRRTRRGVLAALGTVATTGCLRLSDAGSADAATDDGTTAEGTCRYPVTLDFSDVYRPEEDANDWALALACYELTVLGAQGQELATYDVGSEDSDLQILSGAYEPAPEEDYRNGNSFRWFGTPDARTELLVGPFSESESPARLLLRGDAHAADITATVSIGGVTASTVELDTAASTYTIDVPADATCGLD